MTARAFAPLNGAFWMNLLLGSAVLATAVYVGSPPIVVDAGQGSPPELSDAVQTKFRIPVGTKQFRLICPVKGKDGDLVMIQWKKDDEQIGFDFNNRYKLSRSDRELKIKNPQTADSGTYQCQAVNGFGHKELDFAVHVYDPAVEKRQNSDESISLSEQASPPKWTNETEMRAAMLAPLRLAVGGKLHLRCPARGNPLPHISWLHNDKPIERDEITFEHVSAVLALTNVQSADSGEYLCRVDNEHGFIEATFHVRVGDFIDADEDDRWPQGVHAAEQSPVIDEPFNSTVRLGHTAQFQCKVRSQHQPLIKWLKRVDDPLAVQRADANATLIHANNMHLLLLEQPHTSADASGGAYTNRLVIPNANFEHAGTYICVVTNVDGNIIYRSAHLAVISNYDRHRAFLSVYIYVGVPVVLFVLALIAYAVYFLCRNVHPAKGDGNTSTANSVKPITSVRTPTSSVRPPPPNMPLPKAPTSAFPLQQTQLASSSPRYPLLSAQDTTPGSHSPIQRCYPYVSTVDRARQLQYQARPVPIHRTYADDDSSNFYEASSPQPNWAQAFDSVHVDGRDYDTDYPKGRLQPCPSMYSCGEMDQLEEQEQPFMSPSVLRR